MGSLPPPHDLDWVDVPLRLPPLLPVPAPDADPDDRAVRPPLAGPWRTRAQALVVGGALAVVAGGVWWGWRRRER
jgi:hypothetical protein